MNAIVNLSSYNLTHGISPAMILQKIQFESVRMVSSNMVRYSSFVLSRSTNF